MRIEMYKRSFMELLERRYLMTVELVDIYTFGIEEWTPLFSNEERSAGVASVAELADFNKDEVLDIVFGTAHPRWALTDSEAIVGVAIGNQQGEFVTQSKHWVHDDIYSIVPVDLNNDGWLDIVTGGVFKLTVSYSEVDLNGQWLGLTAPETIGGTSDLVEVQDINSDGHLDILTAPLDYFHLPWSDAFENSTFLERDTDHVNVYLGNGTGEFGDPLLFPGKDRLVVVDFDRDGDQDLVEGKRTGPVWSSPTLNHVLLNNGSEDIDFEVGETLPRDWRLEPRWEVKDFVNGDVYPDRVTYQESYDQGNYYQPTKTTVEFGRLDRGYDAPLPISNTHFGIGVGHIGFGGVYDVPTPFFYDVDGNAESDFVQVSNQHVVISRHGNLQTYAAAAFNYPSASDKLARSDLWDINADGLLDFVAVESLSHKGAFRFVQFGQPNGAFGESEQISEERIQEFIRDNEIDEWFCCIEKIDGVETRHDRGGVSVRAQGEKFQVPVPNQTNTYGPEPRHAAKQWDIDNDGDLDLLIGHGSGLAVVLNGQLTSAGIGDVNQDGRTNIRDLRAIRQAWLAGQANDDLFDLNADRKIDQGDERLWIEEVAQTKIGDLNLDGEVGFADFLKLAAHFNSQDQEYSNGDLNGDGAIDEQDFEILRENFD